MTSFEPVVLVPIKALAQAKSRLRQALGADACAELVRAMLEDVLAAAREAIDGAGDARTPHPHPPPPLPLREGRAGEREFGTEGAVAAQTDGSIHLVTSDASYADLAAGVGAGVIGDPGGGYNAAVRAAVASEVVRRAGAAVVLPADLPRARPAEVAAAIAELGRSDVVVVAAEDGGTGLLGLRPPDVIAPAFGRGSAARHLRAAAAAGARAVSLEAPSLACDVDTLEALLDGGAPPLGAATARFVAKHAALLAGVVAAGSRAR